MHQFALNLAQLRHSYGITDIGATFLHGGKSTSGRLTSCEQYGDEAVLIAAKRAAAPLDREDDAA